MLRVKPLIVAVDDGYDWLKVVTHDRQEIFPTALSFSPRRGVQLMRGGRELDERHYEIDGTLYAVGGEVRDPIETRFDDFAYSAENLALAIDAIRQVVQPGAVIHAITGMPLDRYFNSSGEQRESVSTRKRRAWTRPVRALCGSTLPLIVDVTVMSEGVTAWLDYVISDDLQPNVDRINEDTVVIDIGGRTTDVAIFDHGRFDVGRSGTLEHGLLDVAELVTRAAKDRRPGLQRLPHRIIRAAIEHGVVHLEGQGIDVHEEVLKGKRQLVQRLASHVMGVQGRGNSTNPRLLFVGGGSLALETELHEHFPNITIASDTQLANARGMWKHAQLSERVAMESGHAVGAPKGSTANVTHR